MGTESINVIPMGRGSPFFRSLLTIGTIAQSHTGNISPIVAAAKIPKVKFLGIILERVSSDIKIWIKEDKNTPIMIKGRASKIILIKIVVKLCKDELLKNNGNNFLNVFIFSMSIIKIGKNIPKISGIKSTS